MNQSKDGWTIGNILTWTRQYFGEKGVDTPRLDAEVLLSHILGQDRLYLYVHFDQPLQANELAAFRQAVKQRAMRLPVAYITGHKEFMGLDFIVNPQVLIPRPDTEILVQAALDRLGSVARPEILDIGTGSGAIIISLLYFLPQSSGIGVDLSAAALAVAQTNADRLGSGGRLKLLSGNIFSAISDRQFDAIVSNPPYISGSDMESLAPEVLHEPRIALAGGKDGLDYYREIIEQATCFLKPDGFIGLEVGYDQAQQVAEIAEQTNKYHVQEIIRDYAGIERVVILTRRES